MYVDGLGWSSLQDAWDDAKSYVKGELKNPSSELSRDLQVAAYRQVASAAEKENVAAQVGREVGCAFAANIEDAIPKFPIFGSSPDYGPCPKPDPKTKEGASGLGNPQAVDPWTVFAPVIAEAEVEAKKIAEPRIKARLTPWFVGLPIVGALAGLGVGWYLWKRRKK